MTQQIQSIDNLRSNETVLQACRVCEPMPTGSLYKSIAKLPVSV